MEVMVGGLSGGVMVRMKTSVSVSSPEEAVMVMVVVPEETLRSGSKRRSAVPLSLLVSEA